ncbi:MAG TPA: M15 family metallopeptidase [Gemmatimonadales bacterium]|nr:M15 family metallopeptidase [Gemmatimonadales bacterium]
MSTTPLLAQDDGPPVAPDSVAQRLLADVRSGDSTILVEVRYATANNFTGAPLPGYLANRAFLRKEAVAALARVQARLRSGGMGLKVFDGYRPVRATLGMVDWARRTDQMHFIQDGYIASHSRHNLGLAVDLTLVDWSMGGREVDMGTPYDTFSASAHWANATGRTMRYRQLLRTVMEKEGFKQYDMEWWHYSYEVPGEAVAFDMVVR